MKKIDEAKNVLTVAVLVGFLVGLCVNQVTEVIFYLKGNSFHGGWTVIAVIVIIVVLIAVFQFLYVDKIKDVFCRK